MQGRLLIGGVAFFGAANDTIVCNMLDALNATPEPEIIPLEKFNLTNNNCHIFLQAEKLHFSHSPELITNNLKRFIGTKLVSSCVVIYLFNEHENFFIHMDNVSFDLSQEIKSYKNNQKFRAIIVGAGANLSVETGYEEFTQASLNNVMTTLTMLLNTVNRLGIEIEIVAQKVLVHNKFEQIDKYQFHYDLIIEKAQILAKQYFRSEFPVHEFAPSVKIPQFRSNDKAKPDQDFVLFLYFSSFLYDKTSKHIKDSLDNYFAKNIKSMKDFKQRIDELFSAAGFTQLDRMNSKYYPGFSLYHFAFDTQTKVIHIIPAYISTPNEEARAIASSVSIFRRSGYADAYEESTGKYRNPTLYPHFLAECKKLQPLLSTNSLTKEEFIKRLEIEYDDNYHIYYKFIINTMTPVEIKTINIDITPNYVYKARSGSVTAFSVLKPKKPMNEPATELSQLKIC